MPITALFEGADQAPSEGEGTSPVALLGEPYALRLVQAFCALENMELRRSIVHLAEQVRNCGSQATVCEASGLEREAGGGA